MAEGRSRGIKYVEATIPAIEILMVAIYCKSLCEFQAISNVV